MLKQYFPILDWLPDYKKSYLSGDIGAGLTVGIMLIPQGMAYAMIAGLPPVFGLYASLIPQIVYALMGTSRQLAVGPVAMDSLLVASGLGALALSGIDEYIAMAVFLALFMGLIQLGLGLLRMGFLVNFLSKPVISGFTSAAAIIIGLSQLKHLLGTDIEGSNQIHILLINALATLSETNWIALAIGIFAIVVIKSIKHFNSRIPAALVVVVLGVLTVYFFNLNEQGVKIVGEVPSGLPSFKLPVLGFSRVTELLPIALTLSLIAFMEAISVAKAIEEKHSDYKVDSNQELIALGTANVLGSLFQSYPTTGGFSRTAVNDQAGAKTGVAPVVSALVVGLTLLFLTPLFYYLPNAVLAAIIMVAVFGLIDINYPVELFRNRRDEFYLLLATFLITLTVGIKEGILLGVLISLLLLVYRTSRPHIAVLGRIRNTDYFKNIARFPEDTETYPNILIIRFDAQLYFGNREYFKKELQNQLEQKGKELKFIILNAEAINYIDSSAIHMLRQLIQELNSKGIKLLVAGAIGPARDIFYSSGLIDAIGKDNFFVQTNEAFEHCNPSHEKTAIEDRISLQSKT
ncbi:SulP family inorganic anion transporter [Cyclobacterium marinum]|uniref:Sulfate transporter n=1 Tax=Cyclobacterium marinum (strain ATCC 25205 / DSM 745 / LMG 13164 / NCIMB 1802) TaxID=880070 RepID=G0IVL7_CYCMS|nr:sulfate permease [Cyclobacterium marinum]AEL24213.1 sulfate transporter [Cyclobacterium marinum DSM 745]